MPAEAQRTHLDPEEKQALMREASGHGWGCVDCKVDLLTGGILYTYSSPHGAVKLDQIRAKTFPAIEPSLMEAFNLFKGKVSDELPLSFSNSAPLSSFFGFTSIAPELLQLYHFLGYSFYSTMTGMSEIGKALISDEPHPDMRMTIPNAKMLAGRWDLLRENRPFQDLPALDVVEEPSTASDLRFVESYLPPHMGVLSTGIEGIHDSVFHWARSTIPTMFAERTAAKFKKTRALYTSVIQEAYDKIIFYRANVGNVQDQDWFTPEEIVLLEKSLGYMTDSHFANPLSDARKSPPIRDAIAEALKNSNPGLDRFKREGLGIKSEKDVERICRLWDRLYAATASIELSDDTGVEYPNVNVSVPAEYESCDRFVAETVAPFVKAEAMEALFSLYGSSLFARSCAGDLCHVPIYNASAACRKN